MLRTALKAQLQKDGISAEVVDLRTLRPLDKETILRSVEKTARAMVVYEDNLTGGFGAEISALIADEGFEHLDAPVLRVAAPDEIQHSMLRDPAFAAGLHAAFAGMPGRSHHAVRAGLTAQGGHLPRGRDRRDPSTCKGTRQKTPWRPRGRPLPWHGNSAAEGSLGRSRDRGVPARPQCRAGGSAR